MKLERAIEIGEEHLDWCDPVKEVDTYTALKLLIEAGKERLEHSKVFSRAVYTPLLGETED